MKTYLVETKDKAYIVKAQDISLASGMLVFVTLGEGPAAIFNAEHVISVMDQCGEE